MGATYNGGTNMEIKITCVQCKNVISETVSGLRIEKILQALCEDCINRIPQKWRSTPSGSVMSTRQAVTIHIAVRDSAAKAGFTLADARFRTPIKAIREFLPRVSLSGHQGVNQFYASFFYSL